MKKIQIKKHKTSTRVNQKRICHVKMFAILTNEKYFPKTISQSQFEPIITSVDKISILT